MISKSFLGMERPDVSFYFLKKALKIGQRDRGVIEIGRRIQEMMIDLSLDPTSINHVQIYENPIFTDVEVLRRLMKEVNYVEAPSARGNRKKVVAVHSHTLDIGGAERQASLLLELLDRGSVKNSDFSLVTHRIPNKSNIGETYYRNLPIEKMRIKEYIKPVLGGKISDTVDRVVGHLSSLKARRLRNLVRIFSSEEYDVAHTWQDYCNIYGGIAALISGVPRVVMSARTMPPPQKGRLASRQGRSYRECYRILLGSERTTLTHNSDFGNEEYVKWLDVSKEKNITVHNGLDVSIWKKKTKKEFDLRERIGIEKDAIVVGYVGRFTSDKRPWLFLKVAEEILRDGTDIPVSEDLSEWFEDNEGFKTKTHTSLKPQWKGNGLVNFVMLGDGPQFSRAKEIIEKSDILRGKVHLIGFTDRVGEYLRNFDCFVLTSRVEGLPNVIIEAQACGVPVLSTNAGGSRECIIEGETGIIAYDDSPNEMCKYLNEIISNDSFTKKTKKLGAKFVEKKFGIKTYSKSINKLYRGQGNEV
jgi:glycosyltransferase involved in cell wall biosynthesis